MPVENLEKLEQKIDTLIGELKALREKNKELSENNEQNLNKISILEKENEGLKGQLSEASGSREGDQKKIELAAQKVQEILTKLDNL